MPKLIEKPVGLSREDFDRLPPLITRKVFMSCTGLNERNFYIMVELGRIRKLSVGRTGRYHQYYKADAGVIAGYIKTEVKNGIH